ncbi:GTP cyclohydrolase [Rouxiella sp. S1S-2]|uniref:YciI family protein n=1 Tax=Rouxiella sp. S1S-2 TaxID=2653856 RepID=UPI001264326C|nr:YciI family protein [Rouxiella sp. S1S-2]KAB7897471.1 GTP cyclohydrolase [Rouxiella sp. S1S-2]
MFIINVKYHSPIDEINAHLEAHRQFLDAQYDKGIFIASGPQVPREGGVIIANSKVTREELDVILADDPFKSHDLASYHITEFAPLKHHAALADIL